MSRWQHIFFIVLLFFQQQQPVTGQTHASVIPVLCYHNIRTSQLPTNPAYTITPSLFREQMKALKDSGYRTLTPDELYQCLYKTAPVSPSALLISFDDSRTEHYTIAAALLDSLGFKGLFFIMTVTINKPGYLTIEQIRQLAARGHIIGSHTYDHPDLRKISEENLDVQIAKPKQLLEQITGQPVDYMAYPFGAWNEQVIEHIRAAGFKGAFQLTGKTSSTASPYTIQRYMVSGSISTPALLKYLRSVYQPPITY